jgi:hypothetical protein
MFPFVERTVFTGVYRNEARSEIRFLSAGMFSAEIFLVVAVGQNGLTNLLFVLVFLNLSQLQIQSTCSCWHSDSTQILTLVSNLFPFTV